MKAPLLCRRPLHQQISDVLRAEILRRRLSGCRLESESKLARRFSVSTLTVRESLATLANEGLVHRRHGSGTYVADRAERQHVGILVGFDISHPRTSYYYLRIIQQTRRFFETQGLRTKLYMRRLQLGEDPTGAPFYPELLDDIAVDKLCGVAAVATVPHLQWLRPLRGKKVPLIGSPHTFPFGVDVDHPQLARLGTRFLLEQGRRKIACLAWEGFQWQVANKDMPGAFDAFKTTMKEAGVSVRKHWTTRELHPNLTGAGWEEFREIWHAEKEKPDGLLVCDNVLFADVVVAIMELGIRIPDQLLVVTHSVKGSGILHPFPAVRLECDPDLIALTMGEMLVKLMKKETVSEPKIYLSFRWAESLKESEKIAAR
ncbi:MAG: GntR family transcriptional regulator [Verrucomicrobia bacterium]|nr:GntR family transcriptional regulator [Verrucomicrobiota bacterium]